MKDYKFEYIIYSRDGIVIKKGNALIKNKPTEIEAKQSLKRTLEDNYPLLSTLKVKKIYEVGLDHDKPLPNSKKKYIEDLGAADSLLKEKKVKRKDIYYLILGILGLGLISSILFQEKSNNVVENTFSISNQEDKLDEYIPGDYLDAYNRFDESRKELNKELVFNNCPHYEWDEFNEIYIKQKGYAKVRIKSLSGTERYSLHYESKGKSVVRMEFILDGFLLPRTKMMPMTSKMLYEFKVVKVKLPDGVVKECSNISFYFDASLDYTNRLILGESLGAYYLGNGDKIELVL